MFQLYVDVAEKVPGVSGALVLYCSQWYYQNSRAVTIRQRIVNRIESQISNRVSKSKAVSRYVHTHVRATEPPLVLCKN